MPEKEKRKKYSDMDIIMTGFAGLAGSVILAAEKELRTRYSEAFLEDAKRQSALIKRMSEGSDYIPAKQLSEESDRVPAELLPGTPDDAMIYPLSKGGVFAGLWNLAEEAGVGLEVSLKSIPIKQETIEICNFFDINPYQLFSEGSSLILAPNGSRLKQHLLKRGIMSEVIGFVTDNNDRVVTNGEEKRFLEKHYEEALDKAPNCFE